MHKQQLYSSRVHGRPLQAAASSGSYSRVSATHPPAPTGGNWPPLSYNGRSQKRPLPPRLQASSSKKTTLDNKEEDHPWPHTYRVLFLPHIRVGSSKKSTLDSAAIEDHLRPRPSTRLIYIHLNINLSTF